MLSLIRKEEWYKRFISRLVDFLETTSPEMLFSRDTNKISKDLIHGIHCLTYFYNYSYNVRKLVPVDEFTNLKTSQQSKGKRNHVSPKLDAIRVNFITSYV